MTLKALQKNIVVSHRKLESLTMTLKALQKNIVVSHKKLEESSYIYICHKTLTLSSKKTLVIFVITSLYKLYLFIQE